MCDILYEGKSKTIYRGVDDESLIIKFKDTLTAFNGEKRCELIEKGKVTNEISCCIFKYLCKSGIKTHLITQLDENSIIVKKAEIIPAEVIVRNIAAGSFSKKYGVAEGLRLKNATVEFSYKNDKLGDPMINKSQLVAIGVASNEELSYMIEQSLKINVLLKSLFESIGIILIDFKLEFGRCGDELILCDEISPDSCRLLDMGTNEKLDKDRFRMNLGNILDSYCEVLTRLKNSLGVHE